MTIQSAIIAMRSPELTTFFKIFPFFVSDTFFISVIALGCWLASKPRVFWQLGFLIPFSTLLNFILKNLFLVDRPDSSLHMVHIIDKSTGFPSGDVHLASMLWAMLFCNFHSKILRFFAVIMTVLIMISRVYLGVHTVEQVCGGLFFGLATAIVANSRYGQGLFDQWQNGKTGSYWLICIVAISACFIIAESPSPLLFSVSGVMLGYGLAIPNAQKYAAKLRLSHGILIALLGMALLWLANWAFPKIHFEAISFGDSIYIVKYTVISLIIFAVVPMIRCYFNSRLL